MPRSEDAEFVIRVEDPNEKYPEHYKRRSRSHAIFLNFQSKYYLSGRNE